MMLLTVSVALFTYLTFADLVFRTDSNEFVNLLTFKIVLVNSV